MKQLKHFQAAPLGILIVNPSCHIGGDAKFCSRHWYDCPRWVAGEQPAARLELSLSLSLYLSLHLSLHLSLSLCFCWSGHVSSWPPSVLQGFDLVWKAERLWIQYKDKRVSKWVSDQGRPRAARAAKNSHFACCQRRLCNCWCRFFIVIFLIRHEEVFISSKWEKSCLERRLNCSSEFWPAALKVRRTSSVAIIRWTNDCI